MAISKSNTFAHQSHAVAAASTLESLLQNAECIVNANAEVFAELPPGLPQDYGVHHTINTGIAPLVLPQDYGVHHTINTGIAPLVLQTFTGKKKYCTGCRQRRWLRCSAK